MSLPRVSGLFRSALRTQMVPAANWSAKPAKHPISAGEQVIALTTMFVTILVPSGWVLANLENYKKKQ
ncbi:cytochrome c oxidase subunit 8B [Genypterus blacodes]|uniref:cytochrome c oxidase subunit 8B n=1 Tax=Genypterus blacodes TaxID=154954 RepID=UPI003F761A37